VPWELASLMAADEIFVASSVDASASFLDVYQWQRRRSSPRLELVHLRRLNMDTPARPIWPVGIATDSLGQVYVGYSDQRDVNVYAENAQGDDKPLRVVSSGLTADSPTMVIDVAIDSQDNLYVLTGAADGRRALGTGCQINVFPAGGSGDAPPRVLTGILGDGAFLKMAFDSSDNLYVSVWSPGDGGPFIAIYPRDAVAQASGLLSAAHAIFGPRTTLEGPQRMVFDSQGYLYVGNETNVLVFAPEDLLSETGDIAPVATLETPQPGHNWTDVAIAIDSADRLYVGNTMSPWGGVWVYRPEDLVFDGTTQTPAAIRYEEGIIPVGGIAIRQVASRSPLQDFVRRAGASRVVSYPTMVDGNPGIPMGPERAEPDRE
jgi:hypothetical protein